MAQRDVGRHVERRFGFNRRRYTVKLIFLDKGVSVEEVAVDGGPRGHISGVVFESEDEALLTAHHLARNLIGD